MKKLKAINNIILLIFSIVLAFGSLSDAKADSTGVNNLQVKISDVIAKAGDEITVPILLSNTPSQGINNCNFNLQFDTNFLELQDVTPGPLITKPDEDFSFSKYDPTNVTGEVEQNQIQFLFNDESLDSSRAITGDGAFAIIKFKVKDLSGEQISAGGLTTIIFNAPYGNTTATVADKRHYVFGINNIVDEIANVYPQIGEGYISIQPNDGDPNMEDVQSDANALSIPNVTTFQAITSDIQLPTVGAHGTQLTWSSNKPEVISSTGKVTRPAAGSANTIVELKATISKGIASTVRYFYVMVKAEEQMQNISDIDAVAADKEALSLIGIDSTGIAVADIIKLLLIGEHNTTITWTSSNSAVVDEHGTVIRPKAGQPDASITLTATITKGAASDIKVFNIVVKALNSIPATGIKLDKNIITVQVSKTAKITTILQPTNSTDAVTFVSSDPTIATVDTTTGVITGKKEGKVIITAKAGNVTATCTVNVIVDECFIATAAYGSKFQPSVVMLRHFRDAYLLTNPVGEAFVKFYYKHSPPIANFIAHSDILRFAVRILLTPFIAAVYGVLHPIVGVPVLAVTLISAGIVVRRRKLINRS